MPVFSRIFGADPLKTATVTQLRNSSIMHQELIALADPDSSAAVAAVVNTMPGSTAWGLVTRPLGPIGIQGNSTVFQGSSVWQVQVSNGNSSVIITSGNLTSTCVQGTNPWTIAGNSTVAPLAGSTWNTRPIQSSAADLQMTATPLAGSTWNTRTFCSSAADFKSQAWSFDGLGNAVESST